MWRRACPQILPLCAASAAQEFFVKVENICKYRQPIVSVRYILIKEFKKIAKKSHQTKVFSLSTLLCLAVLKVLAVETDIASPEMV